MTDKRTHEMLIAMGFEKEGETVLENRPATVYRMTVGNSFLQVNLENNGTARIDKPNRTKKWVCEKTTAQLASILRQTLSFYTFRG